MNKCIEKNHVINLLRVRKDEWSKLKGKDQDVTQENFVDNVIWAFDYILKDLEKM